MPEMRRDPVTKRWVIIASERAQRLEQPALAESNIPEGAEYDPACFFCEGNEYSTPPEVLAYRKENSNPDAEGWSVRVVTNKYAALTLDKKFKIEPTHMLQMKGHATGVAEVVIESPHHSKNIAMYSNEQIADILKAYRDRYRVLTEIESVKYVIAFRNNGTLAGASIEHPHSQIMATPIIPLKVCEEISGAKEYYESTGKCVFCDMVEQELKERTRLIFENRDFVAFEPYASKTPFETWVMPKTHQPRFEDLSDEQIASLAEVWRIVLKKLFIGLDNPPYNYFIHTSPVQKPTNKYYHWHMELIPKTTIAAGFELGTDMYINISIPEECAAFLRDVEVK